MYVTFIAVRLSGHWPAVESANLSFRGYVRFQTLRNSAKADSDVLRSSRHLPARVGLPHNATDRPDHSESRSLIQNQKISIFSWKQTFRYVNVVHVGPAVSESVPRRESGQTRRVRYAQLHT